jgi:hypothetical protein
MIRGRPTLAAVALDRLPRLLVGKASLAHCDFCCELHRLGPGPRSDVSVYSCPPRFLRGGHPVIPIDKEQRLILKDGTP